jgi:magnesium transporter
MAQEARAVLFRGGETKETADLDVIRQAIEDESTLVWLDLPADPGPDLVKLMTDTLRIHALVLEDIVLDYPIPKIEEFDDFLYILIHGITGYAPPGELMLTEVDILLSERWMVTHHRGLAAVDQTLTECLRNRRLLERGPAYVVHAILDRLVDAYLPVIDQFDKELDTLEQSILDSPSADTLERIFALKRALFSIRRIAGYEREVLARLGRRESPFIPDALVPFFRDVNDHMGQVAFLAESYRELASNVLEMHLSMQSNRLNEVMKTLTMISTIMLPLSLVAGIYGMNFEHMPELRSPYGYPAVLAFMVMVGGVMIVFFRRKKWL